MPSIAWKNTLYKGAFACLATLNNLHRVTLGTNDKNILKLISQRQLQDATILAACGCNHPALVRSGRKMPPAIGAWYHTASIAKMVTAVGALKMCDEGLLSLDAPVADYSHLPVGKETTLRHLLTHTSGIIDGKGYAESVSQRLPLDKWFSINNYSNGYKPGTHFQYSNLGFGLVGSLMEEASGVSLHHWMKTNVFEPLGMSAAYDLTVLPAEAELVSSKRLFPPQTHLNLDALARRQKAEPLIHADPMKHYGLAAGGLYATADALIILMTALANKESTLLKEETILQMLTPAVTQSFDGYSCGFGMGIFCITQDSGRKLYGHQGFAYGAVQGAFWDEKTKACVVSLNGGADETRIGRMGRTNLDIINTFFGG